jgi:hypothetical protein
MLVGLIPPPFRIRRRRGLTANLPLMLLHDHLREAFFLPEDNPSKLPSGLSFRAGADASTVSEGCSE